MEAVWFVEGMIPVRERHVDAAFLHGFFRKLPQWI
jgi:hypothetical protein